MCRFEYNWYAECNHYGIELAEYCATSRYQAGLRGHLRACDHAFNNVAVSENVARHANTLIFYPEISADFVQIWGYCKRCMIYVEAADYFPQPGAPKIRFPPRNLIWCHGQYFNRTWPPYVFLPTLTATLPELFSINANITMHEGIHHPAVSSLFFPSRVHFMASWAELLARNMRNYGMWVDSTKWDDNCERIRAMWSGRTLDEALLGWHGPTRAFGFNKLKLSEAHRILNIRGGISRYDAEVMALQAHAGIPAEITWNVFKGRGIPRRVYDVLYMLASEGHWRRDMVTGSMYTVQSPGWRPTRLLPPPAHGHNGQGQV